MNRSSLTLGLALALPLCSTLAYAETTAAKTQEREIWSGDAELGFVSTSGNTETTTVKTHGKLQGDWDVWRNTTTIDSLNTKEDETRSAEKYFLSNKTDYKFSDVGYIFGYASYDDDRFSGFDWQATVSVGYGRTLLTDIDNMTLNLEVGPGFRSSKVDENSSGEDEDEVILRGSGNFQWKLSDSAVFRQELSIESGADNTISKSITSLKTTIVEQFALKLAYTVKYTEEVPQENKHADTETSITLVYSF